MPILSPYSDDKYNVHLLSVLQYGVCTVCGNPLTESTKAYAGKLKDNAFAIACEDCKDRIVTPVSEYVFFRQEADVPTGDVKLWRYQDFTKFISLLESGRLFFTRADSFEDPFECARGFNYQEDAVYAEMKKYLRITVRTKLIDAGNKTPSEGEVETELKKEMLEMLSKQQEQRKKYFVSCWHENDRESEGMWKLYTSALSQGVAIQTTVERLCRSLGTDCFEIGRVNYISFDEPLKNTQEPVWYKRDGFAHEREVRVVIKDTACKSTGIPVQVNLDTLIEKICVSPASPAWLADLVRNIIQRYGLDKPVDYSQLNEKPVY